VVDVEAQTYLEYIEKANAQIQNKLVEVYQLRCLAESITAPMGTEPVQTSGVSDKVGNITAKIVDLEQKINRMIDTFIDKKQERIEVIEQVEDTLLYTILHKRYVQGKKINIIAQEEHYTGVHISNKHQEALEEVQRILDKKEGQGK
jgi:hypothetical protein